MTGPSTGVEPRTVEEQLRPAYRGLVPAFRLTEGGIRVSRAHSVLTNLGFTGGEAVRAVERLVAEGHLGRDGDRLYLRSGPDR
jgi:hypothetical protein